MPTESLIAEVGSFLRELRAELPGLFPAPQRIPQRAERDGAAAASAVSAIFQERVSHWGGRMGLAAARIRVKDQRSLWGSCSPSGTLNFNWRLTLAPPEVLDYVVIHELAHLKEMNHSRRFWAVVSEFCPEHKARRRWLRENGRALYAARRRVSTSAGRSDAAAPESH